MQIHYMHQQCVINYHMENLNLTMIFSSTHIDKSQNQTHMENIYMLMLLTYITETNYTIEILSFQFYAIKPFLQMIKKLRLKN